MKERWQNQKHAKQDEWKKQRENRLKLHPQTNEKKTYSAEPDPNRPFSEDGKEDPVSIAHHRFHLSIAGSRDSEPLGKPHWIIHRLFFSFLSQLTSSWRRRFPTPSLAYDNFHTYTVLTYNKRLNPTKAGGFKTPRKTKEHRLWSQSDPWIPFSGYT